MVSPPRAPSLRSRPSDLCLRHLTPPRQRFVRLAQRLGFGSVHDLPIRAGDPVLEPIPRLVRRRKNTCGSSARPHASAADFALKREWVAFFSDLDAMGDGLILRIEVANGLPIIHEYEDVIDV